MSQIEREVFGALQEIDSQKEYDLIKYVESINQVIDELESAVNKIEFTVEEAIAYLDDKYYGGFYEQYRYKDLEDYLTSPKNLSKKFQHLIEA